MQPNCQMLNWQVQDICTVVRQAISHVSARSDMCWLAQTHWFRLEPIFLVILDTDDSIDLATLQHVNSNLCDHACPLCPLDCWHIAGIHHVLMHPKMQIIHVVQISAGEVFTTSACEG